MGKIGRVVSGIGTGLSFVPIVLIFIFFSMKSCIVSSWGPPSRTTSYSAKTEGGKYVEIHLLPDCRMVQRTSNAGIQSETVFLAKLRGTLGTHYFWNLWNIRDHLYGPPIAGWRIYENGVVPVNMTIEVVSSIKERYKVAEDREFNVCWLLSDEWIEFESHRMGRVPTDSAEVDLLLRLFDSAE